MFRSRFFLRVSLILVITMVTMISSIVAVTSLTLPSSAQAMTTTLPEFSPGMTPATVPSNTLVLAHWLGWVGLPNHRQPLPRYASTDPIAVSRQISQAQSMGIDGFIVDWYGPATGLTLTNETDRAYIDQATTVLFEQAQVVTDFHIALMYDYGALIDIDPPWQTTQMISDLQHALTHYFTHTSYLTYAGQPLLFLFPYNAVAANIQLDQVTMAISPANASLIYRNPTTDTNIYPYVDGFYSWVQPTTYDGWQPDGSDWGEGYLEWFYNTMGNPTLPYSQMLSVGGVWNGFNDTLAPWRTGEPRFIARRDGQTWLDTWDKVNIYQPPIVQVITWNDWEEGTAVEPDHSYGTWAGIPIHTMDVISNWFTVAGSGAISVGLPLKRAGHDDGAVVMPYALAAPPITVENWIQMRHDFNPALPISPSDHVRIFYYGTATNTLQIGLISANGSFYFSGDLNGVTQVPMWTYTTWDYQSLRHNGLPFSATTGLGGMFISIKRSAATDVGGVGLFAVDGVQVLNLAGRDVPIAYEMVTPNLTVTQQALDWLIERQQANGLLKSWQEETADFAWLYDQALGLIAFTQSGHFSEAALLAQTLHDLQNSDGSWFNGYHYTEPITHVDTIASTGANAWLIYALNLYALQTGDGAAYQDAQEGAAWLGEQQRANGSLPAVPGETTAPTEPNLDAWWAFQSTGFCSEANALRDYLLTEVWDAQMGRFRADVDGYEIFLDNQTWGAAFLQANGRDEDARRALSYAQATLATCSGNGLLCGLDGAGPFSVWNEGTLQYVTAGGQDSQYYWEQMVRQQAPDGGIPGSPDNFQGYSVWLTQSHGIAPTAWLYFAGTDGPFHVAPCQLELAGPVTGTTHQGQTFTATVSPATAVQPITYYWQADGQLPITQTGGVSNTAVFSWATIGPKILTVTAKNNGGIVSNTFVITLTDVPIAGLVFSHSTPTQLGETIIFTATTATGTNIIYDWDFGDGSIEMSGTTVTTHTYDMPGVYIVSVTARNSVNALSASSTIQIFTPGYTVYLPVIMNNSFQNTQFQP